MGCLGYGSHIRQARVDAYREYDSIITASDPGAGTVITTGSKAEGLTCLFESDLDEMVVLDGVLCLENGVGADTFPRETTVFTFNTGLCYHGHSRLNLLERRGSIMSPMSRDALCHDTNGHLLNSDLFVNMFDFIYVSGEVRHGRAGPTKHSSFGQLHIGIVVSLRCHCPGILLKWAERSRHLPLPDIVHKVVIMGAFFTPVDVKGSEYQHLEWRICLNTAENELMNSLNDI
ncbi:hypothetical protein DPMN_038440 [Dreissena polymorpha]|uniref:Uncharacterized protein n=1 Tax=Dreissena polymorpha TaxID=45954 RepID=A0A9D4RQR1_DREPO|nr:hypothetical protein DPMN_038440 [Dreissena polymorpha]